MDTTFEETSSLVSARTVYKKVWQQHHGQNNAEKVGDDRDGHPVKLLFIFGGLPGLENQGPTIQPDRHDDEGRHNVGEGYTEVGPLPNFLAEDPGEHVQGNHHEVDLGDPHVVVVSPENMREEFGPIWRVEDEVRGNQK